MKRKGWAGVWMSSLEETAEIKGSNAGGVPPENKGEARPHNPLCAPARLAQQPLVPCVAGMWDFAVGTSHPSQAADILMPWEGPAPSHRNEGRVLMLQVNFLLDGWVQRGHSM